MDRSFRIDANQLQCPSKLLENLSEFLLQSARAMDTVENPRENHHSASASASRSTKTNPTASDRHRVTRENEDEIEDEQPSEFEFPTDVSAVYSMHPCRGLPAQQFLWLPSCCFCHLIYTPCL